MPVSYFFSQALSRAIPIAYKIYGKAGKEVEWKELVKYVKNQQVVFFGELHNSPISHWLQLKLTQDLYVENKNLSLGAEMFEADQQMIFIQDYQ